VIPFLSDGPERARVTLALAHGAGAPMDSPFLETMAGDLAARGIRVVRFEFPYMRQRRTTGKRGAPDREPVLRETWMEVMGHFGPERLAIGGKSMGGRIASMVADEAGVRGLVCLGYPFHPPGKPERLRTEHLAALRTPTLIVQGTRDQFGSPEEVGSYELSPSIRVVWVEGGDHSFKPPAKSARSEKENLAFAAETVREFLERLSKRPQG
jgi:uncharacterized protein